VNTGKTAEEHASASPSGGEASSAADTQAGVDVKWKFAGKKPGSEVTDPAEPMGSKDPDIESGIKPIKHFEVIDPAQH
jgi:hypothetical protein